MLHLKLTVADPSRPGCVVVEAGGPSDTYPAEAVEQLQPGNVLLVEWGERGVGHLVLAAAGGEAVCLEMSGPAAAALVLGLAQIVRTVWAAEREAAAKAVPFLTV